LNDGIARLAAIYARLLCDERSLRQARPTVYRLPTVPAQSPAAQALRAAAMRLYDLAPEDALPHLDAIKRVMEIDTGVTDSNTVLMRVAVMLP
jgi:hypothetical protein